MSLDIMLCRIVPPAEANGTYPVWEYPRLQRLQASGIICVDEIRIGRNCLDDDWHAEYDQAGGNWRDYCTLFPDEVDSRLLPHVEPDMDYGQWFDGAAIGETPFDFIYISW